MKVYPGETIVIPFGLNQISTNVDLKIMRLSDGFWLDFSDSTFKNSGWVDDTGDMVLDSNNVWTHSWIVPDVHDKYKIIILDVDTGFAYNSEIIEVYGATLFSVISDAGNTASTFKTNRTESTNDKFKKPSLIKFLDGNLKGETIRLLASGAYNGSTKFITVDGAFSAAPNANSRGIIINE